MPRRPASRAWSGFRPAARPPPARVRGPRRRTAPAHAAAAHPARPAARGRRACGAAWRHRLAQAPAVAGSRRPPAASETARTANRIFGPLSAPSASIQKRHTKPIYYGNAMGAYPLLAEPYRHQRLGWRALLRASVGAQVFHLHHGRAQLQPPGPAQQDVTVRLEFSAPLSRKRFNFSIQATKKRYRKLQTHHRSTHGRHPKRGVQRGGVRETEETLPAASGGERGPARHLGFGCIVTLHRPSTSHHI
jgi:hypothetical protein